VPYYLLFEGIGPIIELFGYILTVLAVYFGLLNRHFAWLLFLAAVLYGAAISIASVILEEVSFRRYPRLVDVLKLSLFGVLENFGYRQLVTAWRVRGVFRFLGGHQEWGHVKRKGFERASETAAR